MTNNQSSTSGLLSHYRADYTPRQIRILATYGILAPIICVSAWITGNLLDPSYSSVGKTVSELIETGAPNRILLSTIFVVYNLFLIPFAEGLYKRLEKGTLTGLVTGGLMLTGILGVVWTLFFPLDANGATTSFTATMHLVIGAAVVPTIFIVELGFWRLARQDERWGSYGRYTLALFTVNLFFGIATVALVTSDIRGLVERITQGAFLFWVGLVSIKLFHLARVPAAARLHPSAPQ